MAGEASRKEVPEKSNVLYLDLEIDEVGRTFRGVGKLGTYKTRISGSWFW